MIKSLEIDLNKLQHDLIFKHKLKVNLTPYIFQELLDYLDCGWFYINKEKGCAVLIDVEINDDFDIKKHNFMVYYE